MFSNVGFIVNYVHRHSKKLLLMFSLCKTVALYDHRGSYSPNTKRLIHPSLPPKPSRPEMGQIHAQISRVIRTGGTHFIMLFVFHIYSL